MPGTYCEIDLDKEKRDACVYAIKNHYWYQMYIDDLPIWGKYCMLHLKFGGSGKRKNSHSYTTLILTSVNLLLHFAHYFSFSIF